MADVNMPKLSDTMEEGSVLAWVKKDGDEVKRGEVIAEIETDKASFEIEADADGVLHVTVGEGKPVPVGAQIAIIGGAAPAAEAEVGAGKAEEAAPAAEAEAGAGRAQEAAPKAAAEPTPEPAGQPQPEAGAGPQAAAATPDPEAAAGRTAGASQGESESPSAPSPGADVRASPLARRLAREMGVDLGSLKGSGPEGRIVKEDVLAAGSAEGAASPAEQPSPRRQASAPAEGPDVEVEEPTRMQATIARRMTQSKTTVPHFYVTVEVRMDEAVGIRNQLKASVPGAENVSVTDLLVRACALALRTHPEINASWVDGHFERKRSINIGIAVAQDRGLIVPVIRDVDTKDLVQVSLESRQLIERARAGKASMADLTGGTFSISNLGMFGVDEFGAIINPPEAAILAVGGIKDVPVIDEGRIVPGKVMRMTLSADHRAIYGAEVARFLAEVKKLMENPVSLVLPPA